VLHLRHFVLQASDGRGSRGFLGLQLGRIEYGNQVTSLYWSAFVDQ
jgi:hypothetical protein